MLDRLGSLIEALQGCIDGLDTGQLDGGEAMELCDRFAQVERLGAAGRLFTAQSAVERGGGRGRRRW